MLRAEQGSILRVSGINWPVIVVSNDHFNAIGEAIVCPILDNIAPNAVHIPVSVSSPSGEINGLIACEHVRHVNLKKRFLFALSIIVLHAMINMIVNRNDWRKP